MNQAEMRTAAGMTKCVAMLEGFERGDDAHSITCRTTFKIDESSPSWKRLRNISKRLNFGLIYGAGEGVIREQIVLFVGIDPDPAEVHEWMVDFKAAMPELDKGARLAHWQADQYGYVTMAGGRRRYFRFGEPTHKAFNAKIQGSVSQCMAMAQIEAEAQMPGYQLLQIHDSLLLEVPYDDEGRDIVRAYKAIMQKAFESQIDAPFLVDGKVWH
jgi:DNA polymerase-1